MYEIVIVGSAHRTLRIALEDVVTEWRDDAEGASTARITDQAQLVAVIERMHDLGISIDRVRQL